MLCFMPLGKEWKDELQRVVVESAKMEERAVSAEQQYVFSVF